jgi:hypothetical protein
LALVREGLSKAFRSFSFVCPQSKSPSVDALAAMRRLLGMFEASIVLYRLWVLLTSISNQLVQVIELGPRILIFAAATVCLLAVRPTGAFFGSFNIFRTLVSLRRRKNGYSVGLVQSTIRRRKCLAGP